MEHIIQLVTFIVLMTVGYIAGSLNEQRHIRSLREREARFISMPSVPMSYKHMDPGKTQPIARAEMVAGSVVLAEDYFKGFLAKLKSFFGGNLTSYESLLDRARREAILRMKEQAGGADIIVNTRIESSSISGGNAGAEGVVPSIEAIAFGTALWFEKY
ncbi:MAG: YbjQ family protein [Candidatus Melainabacteria bacterium]